MKKNQELKNEALAALSGNWPPSVVAMIVVLLITYCVVLPVSVWQVIAEEVGTASTSVLLLTYLVMYVFILLVSVPLQYVGMFNAFKVLHKDGDARVTANTFSFTFKGYGKTLGVSLLMFLFTFLWTMLLIVPGIIKAISYSLAPFIIKDNPELTANQAINLSQKMMKGHKLRFFGLSLSFIGWGILCVFTLGIGNLWLNPYMYTTFAAFYQDVKKDYLTNN